MSRSAIILGGILIYIVSVGLITLTLFGIQRRNKKKLVNELNRLDTLKNLIISSGILTEMDKVKALINNEKLEKRYKAWEKRYKRIETEDIPRLSDKLLNAETLIEDNKFKEAGYELAKIELDIYYVKTDSEMLLEEIKEITGSAERNRNAVTKLKVIYREVVTKYSNNKKDYAGMEKNIDLQLDNINKMLSAFELVMEKNDYEEVGKIVFALDDLIKNLKIVIEETPSVILLGKMVIPKKILDLKSLSSKMKRDGYNLEFMNLDKNIEEAQKKIESIFDRLKMLNLEDSIFELKTILDYFESLYIDIDREKECKKEYEVYNERLSDELYRLTSVVKNIYSEVMSLKESYALTDEEVSNLDKINRDLTVAKNNFKTVSDRTLTKVTPYSRLVKDYELISVKVTNIEDRLESISRSLGSLKEDEVRAREQLVEIRDILKASKKKIGSYNMPIIPKNYFVELDEAREAVSEITKELEKKPIVISVLNTRVDTGRDLALKLYDYTRELTKNASIAEASIVYGNRYRSTYEEVDTELTKAEKLFKQGDYRKALEVSLEVLNQVEPGIYKKIVENYEG